VSEVPAVPGVTSAASTQTLAEFVARVFEPGGALSKSLPDFEARAGQTEMAAAVANVFERGGVLLAEAGTGTGKTLAYLVPAILSRQRVLISTGTKNLQEQVFFKDIPALRDALDVPFTATYMKGRANYLCMHRLDQLSDGPGPAVQDVFLPMIREWSERTETGDRAELADLPEDLPFWHEVSATAETCLGSECPRYDDCFVTRMRQRAAASDIVIVNHHLVCADASVRQNAYGEVIPSCSHVILDEAHQLEDVATQYFGYGVSTYRTEDLASDVEHIAAGALLTDDTDRAEIAKAVEHLRDRSRAFFAELALSHRRAERSRGEERVRTSASMLAAAADSAAPLIGTLDFLEAALAMIDRKADTVRDPVDLDVSAAALARRAGELRDDLRFLLKAGDPDHVYFVEFRGRGVFLRATPIDVSSIVRELVLDRMRTTVLTSATLAVDGTFEYIRRRLGVSGSADELRLASEFDFERQAIMYLPPRMPDPRSPAFVPAAGREVVEILKRTRGRAFVLFTSYAAMRAVQAIAEMALDFPIMAQGSAPRRQLLADFRRTPHAVLFATSSFWQGVDVVGDALSCVIIDKLPFASPGDPITAARIDAIRQQGGDPFSDYQVPLAILALQQGLGRLIRHRRDRGVLAILDPRLQTMGYGRRFIASLPPAPVVRELTRIDGFFLGEADSEFKVN
jgi:ATP-dependent DNA helicase DinG